MDEVDALRQQLRDEGAWRAFLEEELDREAEKARTWRTRAEERSARIDRLVTGRSLRQALAARVAGREVEGLRVPDAPAAISVARRAVDPQPSRAPRGHPEVRAATLVVSQHLRGLVAELDARDLATDRDARRDADVAIIERPAWDANPAVQEPVRSWLGEDRRPPLLWWGPLPDGVADLLRRGDRTVGSEDRPDALVIGPWATSPGIPHLPRDGEQGRWVDAEGVRVLSTRTGPALALVDGDAPHRAWTLARAGTPVLGADGGVVAGLPGPPTALDLETLGRGAPLPPMVRRLAIRQRRAVESDGTAADRVTEVLDALAVPHLRRGHRLAVLLSSNRPTLVPSQLAVLASQARRPDEVRVALHGGATAVVRRDIESAAQGLTLHVTEPPTDRPLGTVLNDLADAAEADLLAKIDDDDHYGPHHLVDAIAALDRTGADLVGRKAHYVHLTGEDRTWLLAEDAEDTWTEQGIMGATFVWRRGLHDQVGFSPRPRRVDSLYVRTVVAAGAATYALPANDFAYVRDPGGRTNVAGAAFVRARGRDVGPGLPRDVIDV